MYVVGKGADIMGPGTSLVQRTDWTSPQERQMRRGFGCAGRCGGMCGKCGGLGLFTSMDPTTWGWQEMAVVGIGGYMLLSTFFTTTRAARTVGRSVSGGFRGARSGAREGGSRDGGRSRRRERY